MFMKFLLVDDHALFRDGLTMIINSTFAESKVVHASNWQEALSITKQQRFDIALLDLFMPGEKPWYEELSTFISLSPDLPICIVSASNNQTHVKQVFKLGAKGYIQKTSGASEVQMALAKVVNGGNYIPKPKWQTLPTLAGRKDFKLTWRQKEILMLIAEGNSNKSIGRLLDITESTVKRHVYNLFKTLDAKNRVDAIQIAKNLNILISE